MIYAHLEVLRGNYGEALRELEAGIATVNEPTSMMVNLMAHSGKTVALLLSGRWGELMRVVRTGKEVAERNGNAPWIFIFREAWLRTVALDFEGARALCDSFTREATTEYPTGQPQTIAKFAGAYLQLGNRQYEDALRTFAQILDPAATPKFFLHWYWRMKAQLGLADAWLAAGNLRKARTEADRFLDAVSLTSEPNLLALASEVQARVAMAAKDWTRAERDLESALTIVSQFDVPTTGWRVHATRADLAARVRDETAAEQHRARAEAVVLELAQSFDGEEPLRETFLASPPVRRICREPGSRRGGARPSKH
jgi:tetratricopeptide (TPR) repeat protein